MLHVVRTPKMLKHQVEQDKKLACYVNDINQDGINFDVWSNFIKMIPESATYNIYSAKVKSFNGRYIATSANTVIVRRSKEDLPKSEKPSECLEVCFPAESVDLYDANYTCVRCNRQACESDKLIVCPHCHSKSLLVKSTKKVFIKFTFKNNLKLTMYHDQYLEFCALLSISPNDQAEVEMAMLTAEKIKLKYTPTNHDVRQLSLIRIRIIRTFTNSNKIPRSLQNFLTNSHEKTSIIRPSIIRTFTNSNTFSWSPQQKTLYNSNFL